MRITNSVTREADALEVCQMQCEISRLKVLMTTWTHTTFNLSFSMLTSTALLPVTQKCFFVTIDRMQGRSNNYKTNTFAQTFIFVGTFLFRSRHCCLNSLSTISARKHIVIGLLFPLIGREWGEAFQSNHRAKISEPMQSYITWLRISLFSTGQVVWATFSWFFAIHCDSLCWILCTYTGLKHLLHDQRKNWQNEGLLGCHKCTFHDRKSP
mgnify:FL=1